MTDMFPSGLRAIELRDYQLAAIEAVRDHIRAGKRNILLCAPTGSGKTVVGSYLINESRRKLKRSAFVVDMTALIRQTSETFDAYGIDHGVVQADHPRAKPWELTQICSAQTVAKRRWPKADLLVIDECHVVRKVVTDRIGKRDVVTIGLTATPFTKGLGTLYDALVNVTTTNKLIEDGFLSAFRIYAAVEPDMTGVRIVAGEWVDSDASKKALEVVGDVVKEYVEHGEGRKFICSACDVAHVEALAAQFRGAGINVATYTYRDDPDTRNRIVTEFRKTESEIRGLITVTAASKGFDVPDIGCVIMARPLRKSLAEHIQFFGRGLRIHPSKSDCVVLDHSGNSRRFWNEWNEFFETGCLELDDGTKPKQKKKKDEEESETVMTCPVCKHMHKPRPVCPGCGHEYPRKRAIQHTAGELKELVANGNKAQLSTLIWPQIVYHVREHDKTGDPERMKKRALAIYKSITGGWPKAEFADTQPAPITPQVAGKIRQMNIAWAKSRHSRATA